MSALEDLKDYYENYDWRYSGGQWASRWGGTDMQWYGTVLPRIQLFLPVGTIVEIGSGQGRLSHYLEPFCRHLLLLDITESCVEACQSQFAGNPKVICQKTDGGDLGAAEDRAVDFAFSFFSLVHADSANMRSYILALAEKLSEHGVAFIHHSNAAEYASGDSVEDKALDDYRDTSVDAGVVQGLVKEAGLACRSQEIFGWDSDDLLVDCFSVITRPGSRFSMRHKVFRNHAFSSEVNNLGRLARAYSALAYAK